MSIRGPPVGKRAAQPPPRAAFWTGAPLSRFRLSSRFCFAPDPLSFLPRARSPLLFVSRPISSHFCFAPDLLSNLCRARSCADHQAADGALLRDARLRLPLLAGEARGPCPRSTHQQTACKPQAICFSSSVSFIMRRVKLEVRARGPAAVPPSVRCAGSTASRPEPSGGAAPPSPPSTPRACLYCGVGRAVMQFVWFPTGVSPAGS